MAVPMLLSGLSSVVSAEDLPPTTTIDVTGAEGSDGWYRSDVLIRFYAVDDSGVVAYTKYKIDDGRWKTYTEDVWLSKEGYHTVYYYSVDGAGNIESTKWEIIKLDFTGPTSTCIVYGEQSHGAYYTAAIFVVTATDELSGVAAVVYRIDGGAWVLVYGDTCTAVINVDGTHTFEYYGIDNAYNSGTIKSITVKLALP